MFEIYFSSQINLIRSSKYFVKFQSIKQKLFYQCILCESVEERLEKLSLICCRKT